MSRYKSIKFDQFSDGEQCDIISPTEKSFESSNELVIQKNKVKLGKKIKGGVLYDSGLIFMGIYYKFSFLLNANLYLLASDNSDCFIKKCVLSTGVWSVKTTLPDSGGEIYCLIKFRGLVIANYIDNADAVSLVKYSTNGLTMTAWANTNLIALSADNAFTIEDYRIVHDRLYILGSDRKIYYSDDGITFVLFVALDDDANYVYKSLDFLDGYFYIATAAFNSDVNLLIRINLNGDILGEYVYLSFSKKFYHRVFMDRSYVLLDERLLYRVEGNTLKVVYFFKKDVRFIHTGFVDSLFFLDSDDEIIEMDAFEKMSRSYKNIGNDVNYIFKYGNDYVVAVLRADGSGNAKVAIYESDKYQTPGSIQSQIKKIPEGLAVPKQLILNHKPLTANAWVKVYIKYDQASSWGDAVINSNATNAVRKIYNIPRGTKCSFIQVKIEYGTGNSAETPEDATVEFVYLPVGLLTSR